MGNDLKIELSTKARNICKANYDTNCGGCQLRPECVNGNMGYGQAGIDNWVLRVNELAEKGA